MAYVTSDRVAKWQEEARTMTKAKEPVTLLCFNEDAEVIGEYTDTRMVYRYADRIEINLLGRRPAYQCGVRVIAFSGQRMPCRKSSREALAQIVKDGTWTVKS